ncbi:MAG: mannose-1-phosphate guanylyltransferase [Muribaculaceae bacterium]|nr:mannose-1-phosphate guanylyltransferase [Muribaculaceae bacterium]
MSSHRYCVIMCGGVGSRFWPYSREDCPKQFIDFLGTGRSLLQMSYDRILPIVPKENIVVVTNARYASLIHEQLPDIEPHNILLEPARRNTAPCIAWAAYHIHALDPEASMIVTPSDHLITGETVFADCVRRGFDFVEAQDALLTLGIAPTRPETGYGYIQIGREVSPGILKVKTFTEKPDIELAKVFIQSGEFFWNAGIFLWRADSIISALHKYVPDLTLLFDRGAGLLGTPREKEFIESNFEACPANSIDYAVMEKADNVFVECVSFAWNDLGTWSSLYDNSTKDSNGNVTRDAHVLAHDASNNMIAVPSGKLVVLNDLEGYIVADTGDVLLICPMSEEQRIKQMVNDVKIEYGEEFL